MYYIEKPENAFTMLDGKKQKHRDHREASVARSVLISATERLSEPQGGEFSRMADNRCTDRVGNAVGHGFWLFADSILIKCSVLIYSKQFTNILFQKLLRYHLCIFQAVCTGIKFCWIFLPNGNERFFPKLHLAFSPS